MWSVPAEALVKSEPLPLIPVDPTAAEDDASKIDLPALVQVDLVLVKMYRALAARHDKLVDEVLKKLQQQAQ